MMLRLRVIFWAALSVFLSARRSPGKAVSADAARRLSKSRKTWPPPVLVPDILDDVLPFGTVVTLHIEHELTVSQDSKHAFEVMVDAEAGYVRVQSHSFSLNFSTPGTIFVEVFIINTESLERVSETAWLHYEVAPAPFKFVQPPPDAPIISDGA